MRKVPPSDVLREETNPSCAGGVNAETDLLSRLARLGLGYLLVQQAFEQEQEAFLGRPRYERRRLHDDDAEQRAEDDERLYRNGYEQGRLRPLKVRLG